MRFLVWESSRLAPDYQKEGAAGGYTEHKISDSGYEVSFLGNAFTSKERVYSVASIPQYRIVDERPRQDSHEPPKCSN